MLGWMSDCLHAGEVMGKNSDRKKDKNRRKPLQNNFALNEAH